MKKCFLRSALLVMSIMVVISCSKSNNPSAPPGGSNPTPTATTGLTLTPCGTPALQSSYSFNSGTQCWGVINTAGLATTVTVDTTNQYLGQNTLKVVIPYNATTVTGAQIGIAFPTPVAMTNNSTLTFYYMTAGATGTGQAFIASGPASTWTTGGWQNSLATSWTQLNTGTMALSAPSQVEQIGFQVPGNGSMTSPITVWLAAVSITTPVSTPTCVAMFNSFENSSLQDNGNVGTTGTSSISQSTTDATQGTQSLDVNITSASTYNKIFTLDNFYPTDWSKVVALTADVNVSASVTSAGWCQLVVQADSTDGVTLTSTTISNSPNIAAGQQSVTFNIGISGAPVTNPLKKLYFVVNEQTGGTGNVYFDNMQLVYAPSCAPTPVAAESWNFDDGGQDGWVTFAGGNETGISNGSPGMGTADCLILPTTFTGSGQNSGVAMYFGSSLNASSYHGIMAYVWADSALCPGGNPGGEIQLGDGTNNQASPWQNMSAGQWNLVAVPLSNFPTPLTLSALTYVQIWANNSGAGTAASGNVKIDQVAFY